MHNKYNIIYIIYIIYIILYMCIILCICMYIPCTCITNIIHNYAIALYKPILCIYIIAIIFSYWLLLFNITVFKRIIHVLFMNAITILAL